MKQHNMINDLIQITSKMNLILLTSTNTIIRKFKNQISILNLIFVIIKVIHKLTSYTVN